MKKEARKKEKKTIYVQSSSIQLHLYTYFFILCYTLLYSVILYFYTLLYLHLIQVHSTRCSPRARKINPLFTTLVNEGLEHYTMVTIS